MPKKVDNTVMYMALAGGLYVLYRVVGGVGSLLESLGLKDSANTKDLDDAGGNSASFWSPNFWKAAPAGAAILTNNAANELAGRIWNAFGMFNDDEDAVAGVLRGLKTQTQLSYLADVFYQIYQQDLLTFLRGGSWPQDRMSDDDVAMLQNYIASLPKYYI